MKLDKPLFLRHKKNTSSMGADLMGLESYNRGNNIDDPEEGEED
jgi:hypothetical protein